MGIQLVFMQRTIQLSFIHLLIPFFIAGGVIGWKRGWKEEAITSVGLLFALLLFSNDLVAERMAELLNRIVAAFGIFIDALFGRNGDPSEPFITGENFAMFRTVGFFLGVVLAYVVGSAIGERRDLGHDGKVLGALVGVLNSYIVMSRVLDFIRERQETSGLPFDTSSQIIVPPIPETNELRSNLPTIFALLFLIVLVVTFFRLPRREQ